MGFWYQRENFSEFNFLFMKKKLYIPVYKYTSQDFPPLFSVQKLIEEEEKAGISANRIMIGGFSQGGAVALHRALATDQKLAGVVGLSTWLPLHRKLDQVIHELVTHKVYYMHRCYSRCKYKIWFVLLKATLGTGAQILNLLIKMFIFCKTPVFIHFILQFQNQYFTGFGSELITSTALSSTFFHLFGLYNDV